MGVYTGDNGGDSMSEAIVVAIITGLVSLIGTVSAVYQTSKKTSEEFKIQQAIMNERLDNLTREVREHNNFAQRMPVVEEQIKVINHRLEDLEEK